MAEKFLRGKQPLTMYRGSTGTNGGYLYRGGVKPANEFDAKDADRLVGEGFLEWVVRDGEGFVLAEDTPTGSAGDPVQVGDAGLPPADENDVGTINDGGMAKFEEQREAEARRAAADAEAKAAAEVDAKRAEAQAKLAEIGTPDGRSSQAVWVEFLVGRGQSYDDVKDVSKAELQKLAEQQSR